MKKISLYKNEQLTSGTIHLPASKSESNRALIINALGGKQAILENLSAARDTRTMLRLLEEDPKEVNVLDAGTTMRFLTSFYAISGKERILTGTERMQQRPIGILVDALRVLGAKIEYLSKDGFPPFKTLGFEQKTNEVQIAGDVSSQFISALLMIAPILPQGLKLTLTGKVGSRPYIEMTLALMRHFRISFDWSGNTISIAPQSYGVNSYSIESDWSGASYWFSMATLSEGTEFNLIGLKESSWQGDHKIIEIMSNLGVKTIFTSEGLKIRSGPSKVKEFSYDFTHCPDLAQTVAVACAIKGVKCSMTGLESLRVKETDRIIALQNEMGKFGAQLLEGDEAWQLIPSISIPIESISIHTYEDHRMAMAFAPLATRTDVIFDDASVVNKSYPSFWKDVEGVGIKIKKD